MNPVPAASPNTEAETLAAAGRRLAALGLSPGSSGNLSMRTEYGFLATPTGAPLAAVRADHLSALDTEGGHRAGPAPTKGPHRPAVSRGAALVQSDQMSYRGFLAELLMAECADRACRRSERRAYCCYSVVSRGVREENTTHLKCGAD